MGFLFFLTMIIDILLIFVDNIQIIYLLFVEHFDLNLLNSLPDYDKILMKNKQGVLGLMLDLLSLITNIDFVDLVMVVVDSVVGFIF